MQNRREQMLAHITSNGEASIAELSSVFPDVSTMTIRRDLEFLEARGDVVRTKGGAKSIRHLSLRHEAAYHHRESENADLKREIAAKTVSLIDDDSCVYFDAGSTMMHVAQQIGEKPIFAITNDPNLALELIKNPNCEVSMTSGKLSRRSISLSGLGAEGFLSGINIGTAIMASSGYSADLGFTCGTYDEAALKRAVIASAKRVILVMDSTKLMHNHPFTFAKPADIDCFVTDSRVDKSAIAHLARAGVRLF